MTYAINSLDTREIDPTKVRDLRPEALDADGRIRILPAAFWAATTVDERAMFGSSTGHYSFPTVELVDYLKEFIAGRLAIEVGAGNGVLAQALGIPATDNFQQRMPQYQKLYESMGQAIVPYGPNVIDMPAGHAVRYYRPDVVIGCWVTHKFDPKQPHREGNEIGLDEDDLLDHCAEYVLIGNDEVHKHKPIWDRPHVIKHAPFVYSRAFNGSPDFLVVFRGLKR
jgi:hypothetical protein